MPKLLNIVGCKNSGKTRTIEMLIPVFRNLGMKTGTLKHTEHDLTVRIVCQSRLT